MDNIAKGYMKTEIGVIPKDWACRSIGDLCYYQNGTSLEKYFNRSSGLKVISIGNYSDSGRFVDTDTYISKSHIKELSKFVLRENDLTMILNDKTSSGGIIGRVLLVEKSNKYIFNQRTMRLVAKNDVDPKFLYFQINSDAIHRKFVNLAKPGTQIYVNTEDVTNLLIQIPETKLEQRVIATTLSDIDSLITSFEKLIRKKKMIKQGVMQELLTGKRRLAGFNGEWKSYKLGSVVGRITTGKLDANAMNSNGLYRFYTCAKDFYYIDTYAFDAEALLISGNGANVGYIHYYKGKFNAYQRTYVLTDFKQNIFFTKLFMDKNLQERIRIEVNAGNTPYITLNTLSDMLISFPPTLEEQKQIAEVINEMEKGIYLLESKLSKLKQIKQGAMQQLLTGKIRLINK